VYIYIYIHTHTHTQPHTHIYKALIFFSHHVYEEHNLACDEDLLETLCNDVCHFSSARKYDFKMQWEIILMHAPCIFYCIHCNQQIHNITTVCLYIIYTATYLKTCRSIFYIKWYCHYDINCTFKNM